MNIGGAKTVEAKSSGQREAPAKSSGTSHKTGNRNVARLKLASQQDDTEGDDGNPEVQSPKAREVTETNDSCGYENVKGMKRRKFV